VRLPVPVAGLNAAPATVADLTLKANSGPIPTGFNPDSPASVAAALATLSATGTDRYAVAQPGGADLIGPVLLIEDVDIYTGPSILAEEFPYALVLPTEEFTLATGPSVREVTVVEVPTAVVAVAALAPAVIADTVVSVPAAVVTVEPLAPGVSTGASVEVPAAVVTVAAAAPEVTTLFAGALVEVPAAGVTMAALVPEVLLTAVDPNFSSVGLLLHMDGSNGSTTFIDTSPSARTVTAVGNAQIDTSQAKFGTASAKFDGNGDALTVPYASAWDFGSGNFTVEGWVRPRIAVTTRMNLVSIFDATSKGWGIAILDTGKLRGFVEGASLVFIGPGPTTVADSVWHHFAMVRNGNNFAIYLNGAQEATATSSLALGTGSGPLQIGAESGAGIRYLDGWLDEIRITKGVARYTSAFTPPTAPFPDT
jgi:hypothetical protein